MLVFQAERQWAGAVAYSIRSYGAVHVRLCPCLIPARLRLYSYQTSLPLAPSEWLHTPFHGLKLTIDFLTELVHAQVHSS